MSIIFNVLVFLIEVLTSGVTNTILPLSAPLPKRDPTSRLSKGVVLTRLKSLRTRRLTLPVHRPPRSVSRGVPPRIEGTVDYSRSDSSVVRDRNTPLFTKSVLRHLKGLVLIDSYDGWLGHSWCLLLGKDHYSSP